MHPGLSSDFATARHARSFNSSTEHSIHAFHLTFVASISVDLTHPFRLAIDDLVD